MGRVQELVCEGFTLAQAARVARLENERDEAREREGKLDLERAKLLVEADKRRGRRLSDGVEVMVGQRVVLVREACERSGLSHGFDELVHEVTSTLGGDTGLVECGPRQIYTGHLRLAPAGSEVTCPQCAGWRMQMARMRHDAEAYRTCQVDAFGEAAMKHVPKRALPAFDMEWSKLLDEKRGRLATTRAQLAVAHSFTFPDASTIVRFSKGFVVSRWNPRTRDNESLRVADGAWISDEHDADDAVFAFPDIDAAFAAHAVATRPA